MSHRTGWSSGWILPTAMVLAACAGPTASPDTGLDSSPDLGAGVDLQAPDARTGPSIVLVTPADKASKAPVNTEVTVTFDRAVDPGTVTGSSFRLERGGQAVAATITVKEKIAILRPAAALSIVVPYRVSVTSGVKDLQGGPLVNPKSWSFSADRHWTVPATLGSTFNVGDYSWAASNAAGEAMVTWVESSVRVSRLKPGQVGWPGADLVSPSGALFSGPSWVALNSAGAAVVVWRQGASGKVILWSNRFDPTGGSWGTATRLDSDISPTMFPVSLALDDGGDAMLVYDEYAGYG